MLLFLSSRMYLLSLTHMLRLLHVSFYVQCIEYRHVFLHCLTNILSPLFIFSFFNCNEIIIFFLKYFIYQLSDNLNRYITNFSHAHFSMSANYTVICLKYLYPSMCHFFQRKCQVCKTVSFFNMLRNY